MANFVKAFARNSIENPNVGRSFVLFLLPILLTTLVAVVIGLSLNGWSFLFNIFLGLVYWLFSAFVLFVLVRLLKGANLKATLKGLFAGLAFRYLFEFFLALFGFAVLFVVVPEIFPIIVKAQQAPTTIEIFEELAIGIEALGQKNFVILFGGFLALIIATILTIFLVLYLVYELVSFSGKGTPRQNLLVLTLWVLIQAVLLFLLAPIAG
ncbi:MAG: hypothetical protein HYW50_00115 [Candidatus Diapherotrites archaeon]|nr:hypothetical protein [Candidatus Diapherotrites archaeon]